MRAHIHTSPIASGRESKNKQGTQRYVHRVVFNTNTPLLHTHTHTHTHTHKYIHTYTVNANVQNVYVCT